MTSGCNLPPLDPSSQTELHRASVSCTTNVNVKSAEHNLRSRILVAIAEHCKYARDKKRRLAKEDCCHCLSVDTLARIFIAISRYMSTILAALPPTFSPAAHPLLLPPSRNLRALGTAPPHVSWRLHHHRRRGALLPARSALHACSASCSCCSSEGLSTPPVPAPSCSSSVPSPGWPPPSRQSSSRSRFLCILGTGQDWRFEKERPHAFCPARLSCKGVGCAAAAAASAPLKPAEQQKVAPHTHAHRGVKVHKPPPIAHPCLSNHLRTALQGYVPHDMLRRTQPASLEHTSAPGTPPAACTASAARAVRPLGGLG